MTRFHTRRTLAATRRRDALVALLTVLLPVLVVLVSGALAYGRHAANWADASI